MSWINMLYDTYENCTDLMGKVTSEDRVPLLPIAHTTQNAHIELRLDASGHPLPSSHVLIEKVDCVTILPCTERSQSRANGCAPHPLFDNLSYLAGDYTRYGGKKSGAFHEEYRKALEDWCASPFAHPRVQTILAYLQRGTLIADLIALQLLPTDEQGGLIRSWKPAYGEKRGVFESKAMLPDVLDAFVRIDVDTGDAKALPVWRSPDVWDSYIRYTLSQRQETDLCYVTGRYLSCSDLSPGKIRNAGDRAKLISSNDSSGFTYRGRFTEPAQVVRIGYEVTQKAHNALKWLIAEQGCFRHGDQVYVAWSSAGSPLPPLDKSTLDMQGGDDLEACSDQRFAELFPPDVETGYAQRLAHYFNGYGKQHMEERENVAVMGLDSATTGRLSIIYYREMGRDELLRRARYWHESCAWMMHYRKVTSSSGKVTYPAWCGAPSPTDIVSAAYGFNIKDNVKSAVIRRLLPCILDGAKFPRDIMIAAFHRARNPVAMEDWQAIRTRSVACAVIRKYYIDHSKTGMEEWTMSLDKTYHNGDRSYIFGCLLAYYDYMEEQALFHAGEKRSTNAQRFFEQYGNRPMSTLSLLQKKYQAYSNRLYWQERRELEAGREALMTLLDGDGSTAFSDQPLSPLYILGFDSQSYELRQSSSKKKASASAEAAPEE